MSNPSFKRKLTSTQLNNAVTYRQSNMKLNSEVIIKIEKVAIHPCSVCPKAYTCLDDYNKHITEHDPSNIDLKDAHILKHIKSAYVYLDRSKSFQCEHCGDSFQHCRDYKLHKLIHIQQAANVLLKASKHNNNDSRFVKLYKCSECDSRFVARSTLIAHAEAHEPRSHVCHCGIGYFKKCDLNSHRKLVHPDYKEPEVKVQVKEIIKTKLGSYLSPKFNSKAKSKKVKRKNGQRDKKAPTERRFGCPVCEKTLANKRGLIVHLRTHTGEKPYPCGLCGKRFAQASTRTIHLKRHAGVKDFECEHCGKSFYMKGALDLHLRVHTKEKPYKCMYCEKAFSDPSALGRHHRIHTGLKPYQCPLCPNKYSDMSALVTHKQRHVNYKAAECELCHKKFPSKHNMRNHLKVMHTNIKDYECSECGKTFALKSYLKTHIRISHMPRQYRCSYCGEDLGSKASLATHCGTVHNCAECKRGFPSNSHMVGHILYHPGAWFECDECGADYNAKTILHQHIAKKHSNIRCNVCSWRVMSKSELVKHKERGCLRCQYCNRGYTKSHACRWKHSKPSKTKKLPKVGLKLVCDSCGQGYSSKQLLVNHIRLVHTVTLFCSECPDKFYSDELFQRHKLKGCKQIECEICGEVVFSQRNYERHLEAHSGVRHKCHKCDRSFGKEDVLKKHLIVRHGLN